MAPRNWAAGPPTSPTCPLPGASSTWVAVTDWRSRNVVAWRLSNTLEAGFCVDALQEALGQGWPEVFNTDQGSQFTSGEFTHVLQDHCVKINMDGNRQYPDNIFVAR